MKKDNLHNIISIVTPSYNQGGYIEDTIKSICFQEGNFFIDYVVVDNLSVDNTLEIIKKYYGIFNQGNLVKNIKGVKFYKNNLVRCNGISFRFLHEKDSGHADALNKGFSLSIGDILAWLNSDDKYFENAFTVVTEIFNKFSSVEWITGKSAWFDKRGDLIGDGSVYKNIYDFLNYDYKWIQQESTFWRRSLWIKSGSKINEGYRYMVDGELWCRFFLEAELYHVDEKLGGYRMHDTNRAAKFMKEILKEMDTAILLLKQKLNHKTFLLFERLRLPDEQLPFFKDVNNICYKILIKGNNGWVKNEINYLFFKQLQKVDNLIKENNNLVKQITALPSIINSQSDGLSVTEIKKEYNLFFKFVTLFKKIIGNYEK
jgi:glycosyltransferase involved in cell wall biosynthesis